MRCAQILNGVVVNVIEADPTSFAPGDGSLIVASDTAQCGDAYANGVFTPAAAQPVYQTQGLTFLQFMALFTSAEQAAIISSTDLQTRVFVVMATGAGSLDLDNAEVVGAVGRVASLGLVASARVPQILAGIPPAS
jgi:hypothetical protein